MPVTMTWNLVSEQAPEHQEEIIWLRVSSSFTYCGYEPREVDVEYVWAVVDEEGEFTGNCVTYEKGDKPEKNWRLLITVDGWELLPTDLWMSQADYYNFLEENIPILMGETK